jgi:hypothetical protein
MLYIRCRRLEQISNINIVVQPNKRESLFLIYQEVRGSYAVSGLLCTLPLFVSGEGYRGT